jgi:tetratricopeptide (TPR) repeat protein
VKCPQCRQENAEAAETCSRCGSRLTPLPDPLESPTDTFPGFATALPPGSLFAGRYRITEDLGIGGMGKVYKVFDTEIGEMLALKLVLPGIAADRITIARFQNELKLARKISHKNVCRVHDLGKEKETYYITMEYVEGRSLKSLIETAKALSPDSALSLARQLCAGLEEAHRQGVVHRDLKPQNVMIDKDGNAKIMDFGLARSIETGHETRRGVIIGTPEYMSPEQAEGKEADGRSDIYSLGVILFEMLTGGLPFAGRSTAEILHKQKTETPEEPGKLQPGIPDGLNRVVLGCLEKKKEDRYQTAADLGRELESIGPCGRPSGTRAASRPAAAAGLRRFILPAMLFVAVSAAGVFIWKHNSPRPPAGPFPDVLRVAVITFVNQTGDVSYDYLQDAIPNLLITSLEQTEGLRVTAWERLADLLKRLGKQDLEAIDRDLGFELGRLDGIDVIVLGSYKKTGNTFVTNAKAYDVRSKDIIRSVSARGEGIDSLLKSQIDEVSAELARALTAAEGVGRAEVTPVTEMTTGVMEAYDSYLKGRDALENARLTDARDHLEKTVRIDPGFSLAYLYLAKVHSLTGDLPALRAIIQDFRPHQKPMPGREGLTVEALTARFADNDLERYFRTLTRLVTQFPLDKRAHVELAEACESRGMLQQAEAEYLRALEIDARFGPALDRLAGICLARNEYDKALEYLGRYAAACPDEPNPREAIGGAYFFAGRFDRAIEAYQEALKIRPDFGSDLKIGYCCAVREDYAEALRWTDRFIAAAPAGRAKAEGYLIRGFYLEVQGRLVEAFKEWEAAEALLRSAGDDRGLDEVQSCRLWMYYDWGKADRFLSAARIRVEHRLTKNLDSQSLNRALMEFYEGLHDVRAGKLAKARAGLDSLQSRLSEIQDKREDGILREASLALSAELLLARGRAGEAAAEFEKTARPAVGLTRAGAVITPNLPFRDDFPARAMTAGKDLDGAIAEYRRLLNPMNTGRRLVHPMARYRLAKLYEQAGRRLQALEQYRRVVETWENADGDLGEVLDARARLAALENP